MGLTSKMEIGLESIWKLAQHVAFLIEGNLQAGLRCRYAGQVTCMWIKDDNMVSTSKGWQVCVVVDSRPSQAISACKAQHTPHQMKQPQQTRIGNMTFFSRQQIAAISRAISQWPQG